MKKENDINFDDDEFSLDHDNTTNHHSDCIDVIDELKVSLNMNFKRKVGGEADGFVNIRCRDQNLSRCSFQRVFEIQTKRRK